ncbi:MULTISPECIES: hypothetical protein [Nostoc]
MNPNLAEAYANRGV